MNQHEHDKPFYIGLMSGTSLDGVDAVAADFSGKKPRVIGHLFAPYPQELRDSLSSLCTPGDNEIERAGDLTVTLGRLYAEVALDLIDATQIPRNDVRALGVHGQTVRHRPAKGWSLQLNYPALVAELTGIDVVADFRSRDLAAEGEGAPLVPAFHKALFSSDAPRAVVNLGGIANVTRLPGKRQRFNPVSGFDCGPSNTLMDAWCAEHTGAPFDADGAWAKTGTVCNALLTRLLSHPYFARRPPKSTGREEFNLAWVKSVLSDESPEDVQRTLLELTARTVAQSCEGAREIYLCGGGTKNALLLDRIGELSHPAHVATTAELGIDPMHVEALAFAWLARAFFIGRPGNLCEATHARGLRVLGALYPH